MKWGGFILLALIIACTAIPVQQSGREVLTTHGLPATTPTPTMATPRNTKSKIAFSSNRDGNGEIYVMNADGSGQTRLTNNSATEDLPAWSPDGSKIAFRSDRDGNSEVYVM
ncbi:MAG: exported protein of unknown function, partial [Dehalococcoidia bacterium]|nr:exported protein of unknown function [Dehalococcoidia bacterium]